LFLAGDDSGKVKIRPVGETIELWTAIEAVR